MNFAQRRELIRNLAEDVTRNATSNCAVGARRFRGPLDEVDVADAALGEAPLQLGQHAGLQVERRHLAGRPDAVRRRQRQPSGAAAGVEHPHARRTPARCSSTEALATAWK